MKKIDSLFFELLQVAVGHEECLSRGPEPDEWQTLYDIAKLQHVEGITYQAVMKLFEYGLRAPHEVSLDWMADAESIREVNESTENLSKLALIYDEDLQTLRLHADNEVKSVSQFKIQYLYQQYLQNRFDMRMLLDYYYVLRHSKGKYETLKGGGLLGSMGIRRFARGVMWMLQETMKLDKQYMPFETLEIEGRFLLTDMMQEASKLERIGHVLFTYPLGIKDLRA